MANWTLRILETPAEMAAVEDVQRQVWAGSELEIVPAHLLLTAAHNGGLVIGAYPKLAGAAPEGSDSAGFPTPGEPAPPPDAPLLGFVFGFPGVYTTPDGPRLKHCSHMLGVLPAARDQGLGFVLKRAQWQMVRHQGIDRITWTYDPLLSRNAHLNIARLGAVCNTYLPNEYGPMRDEMNAELDSDRFQVDWWVNTQRVSRRLSKRARLRLDLAHFLAAGAEIVNPTQSRPDHLPQPGESYLPAESLDGLGQGEADQPVVLVEIPADFQALKTADLGLARAWRQHTRALFQNLFARGYLVTDFVFLPGAHPRSFYVLSHGEATL